MVIIINFKGFIPQNKIFIVTEHVDFRLSINGLSSIVQEIFKVSPTSDACYIFINKAHDKLKIIQWDFNGFWLHYKRLESGKFVWPSSDEQLIEISLDQYTYLMNGLSINQRDGFKEVFLSKVI